MLTPSVDKMSIIVVQYITRHDHRWYEEYFSIWPLHFNFFSSFVKGQQSKLLKLSRVLLLTFNTDKLTHQHFSFVTKGAKNRLAGC